MWLFLLFLSIPLVEIALFIEVGGAIGLFNTLVVVVLTAILGTYLVRQQGGQVLRDLRRALDEMGDPSEPLIHGAMILFAGALLLTPGFFTDAVGLSLLVPPVRTALFAHVARRLIVMTPQGRQNTRTRHEGGGARPDVIDGDYEEMPDKGSPGEPSGWTRH